MAERFSDLNLPSRLLLGPGPANIPPQVARALTAPLLGHLDPDFLLVLEETQAMVREVFRTSQGVSLLVSGTGMAGMECAFVNVVEQGDPVLVVVNGYFGLRMIEVAERCGAQVHRQDVPWGRPVTPDDVRRGLEKAGKVKVVALVYAETSTGVFSPLPEIARVVHEHGALLLVDAVTALAGIEFYMDDWGVDVCYSGPQKCLGGPPGMAPVSFNDRALKVVRSRRSRVQSYYLDIELLQNYWGQPHGYHHTIPVLMIYAMREALRLVLEEGLEARWERHARHASALRAGLEAMGLELFAHPDYRLNPLTTVRIPDGVDDARVRGRLLREHDIEIGGGLGDLRGKIWRIGLMGYNSQESSVFRVLSALERVLTTEGVELPRGEGVRAASQAYA